MAAMKESIETTTKADVKNHTNGSYIRYHDHHNWRGSLKPGSSYPEQVNRDDELVFEHDSTRGGDKAAVVYKGSNKPDSKDMNCAWLVAWLVSDAGRPNKVYVECGPITKYDEIDWEDISDKLESSGCTSNNSNQRSKTKVSAKIGGGPEPQLTGTFNNIN